MLYIDLQNNSQIIVEQVILEIEGGWWICEVGLFDEIGVLIVVGNCFESYKLQLIEGSGCMQIVCMVLIISSIDNIILKIDFVVVLVICKYVDDKVLELKVYVDDLMVKYFVVLDLYLQYVQKDSLIFIGILKVLMLVVGNSIKQIVNMEFVVLFIVVMVDFVFVVLDMLNELVVVLGNDLNFVIMMLNVFGGKQLLDNMLMNLSGKDVVGFFVYFGLGEMINCVVDVL